MTAARALRIGSPNVITNDDLPQPEPAVGQLLVRVKAAARNSSGYLNKPLEKIRAQ
jgi:NADPH:quinone reductase-like Zn-dependent oxidoreductase